MHTNLLIWHNYHDVSICCKKVNISGEVGIADFHSLKLSLSLATAEFELLDNITDFFESMDVPMIRMRGMRNDQKCGSFEQDNFISITNRTEIIQMFLKVLNIGDQRIHDWGPSAIKCFIPNWGSKTNGGQGTCPSKYHFFLLFQHLNEQINKSERQKRNERKKESRITRWRLSSGTRSILWIKTKTFALLEFWSIASRQPSKCAISFYQDKRRMVDYHGTAQVEHRTSISRLSISKTYIRSSTLRNIWSLWLSK